MRNGIDPRIEKILISENQIQKAIADAADWINITYQNQDLLIVTILKGSIPFVGSLMPKITIDFVVDYIAVSSFQGHIKAKCLPEIISNISSAVKNKNILLVEDIVDSGKTIAKVVELLKNSGCSSCRILTLLDKPSGRNVELKPDYICFEIENEFVVGFGLDYKEFFRNLPYIGILKQEVYQNDDIEHFLLRSSYEQD